MGSDSREVSEVSDSKTEDQRLAFSGSPKLYNPTDYGTMQELPWGDWVAVSDYIKIRAALEGLTEAVGELPETADGMTQGQKLNKAYSLAISLLTSQAACDKLSPR